MNDLVTLGIFTLAIFVTGFVCGGAATAWQLVERRPRRLAWDEEPSEHGPFEALPNADDPDAPPPVFADRPKRPPVDLRPVAISDRVVARHAEIVRAVEARMDGPR